VNLHTLEYADDCSPIEPRPEKPRCYYCSALLDPPHEKDGLRIVAAIATSDLTEHEALMQGLICMACIQTFECAHCGQIGGDILDPPRPVEDSATGYRDDEKRCTFCAPGSWLREPAQVEREGFAIPEAA
jgi:hypothetical protein